jgi:hypothetical protein
MTAGVQLEEKMLVASHKGLVAKKSQLAGNRQSKNNPDSDSAEAVQLRDIRRALTKSMREA